MSWQECRVEESCSFHEDQEAKSKKEEKAWDLQMHPLRSYFKSPTSSNYIPLLKISEAYQ
jgi:hypothetical protein